MDFCTSELFIGSDVHSYYNYKSARFDGAGGYPWRWWISLVLVDTPGLYLKHSIIHQHPEIIHQCQ